MDLGAAVDRLEGYKSALKTHHMTEDPKLIYHGTFFQPEGFAGASELLDLDQPPTAIFASNDVMAMGAMDAVRNRGLRVPGGRFHFRFRRYSPGRSCTPGAHHRPAAIERNGWDGSQMLPIQKLNDPEKEMARIELHHGADSTRFDIAPEEQGWLTTHAKPALPFVIGTLWQKGGPTLSNYTLSLPKPNF